MSLLKYLERLKRMDDLIHRKATGNPEEFAEKIGISRSQLLEHIKELRELGAEIEYCTINRSYYFKYNQSLMPSFAKGASKI